MKISSAFLLVPVLWSLAPQTAMADTSAPHASSVKQLPVAGLGKRVDAALERAIKEKRIVGAVVLVAVDGKLVYHRAIGEADREAKHPMREDEIFRLASMTKSLVSASAMALVEQGKLRLDDPVARWIPNFKPRLKDGRIPVITVKQLLTHTAGLTYGFLEAANGPYHQAHVSDGLAEPGISMPENLRRIASVPLSYEPGKGWGYSVAIDVLGEVVARAAKKPLPVAVSQLVTAPLGMRDTAFPVRDVRRLATPYADGKTQPVRMGKLYVLKFGPSGGVRYAPERVFNLKSFPSGGAGMVGTAGDYLKFLEALRRGGSPILKRATVAQMMRVQTGDLEVNGKNSGLGFGYGFSVLKNPPLAKTPQSRGTIQWGGAYGHNWFVDPAQRLTVVALTNTAIEGMSGKFTVWVRDAVYGAKTP